MTTVQSVERALSLLEEVGREPGGLVDLAARVDLATSTAARLLGTLESAGAVRRLDDGIYRIGALVQVMAGSLDPGVDLQTAADRHLVEMAAHLDEAVCLAILVGTDTVTIRQVDAPKPVQAEDWTGTRVPLHAGCAGLVVMATWPDPAVDKYLAGELSACSEQTVTDPRELRMRVDRIRVHHTMWSHGEYVAGLSSCAAAVRDARGRAVGALYTYGPTYRFPPSEKANEIAGLVLTRADEISADLGFRPTKAENS